MTEVDSRAGPAGDTSAHTVAEVTDVADGLARSHTTQTVQPPSSPWPLPAWRRFRARAFDDHARFRAEVEELGSDLEAIYAALPTELAGLALVPMGENEGLRYRLWLARRRNALTELIASFWKAAPTGRSF